MSSLRFELTLIGVGVEPHRTKVQKLEKIAAELRGPEHLLQTEHGFLGKSGADLPGPKHVAQKRSTVWRGSAHLLAKNHRAWFSLQTRRGSAHFAQEHGARCSWQNRRGAAQTQY